MKNCILKKHICTLMTWHKNKMNYFNSDREVQSHLWNRRIHGRRWKTVRKRPYIRLDIGATVFKSRARAFQIWIVPAELSDFWRLRDREKCAHVNGDGDDDDDNLAILTACLPIAMPGRKTAFGVSAFVRTASGFLAFYATPPSPPRNASAVRAQTDNYILTPVLGKSVFSSRIVIYIYTFGASWSVSKNFAWRLFSRENQLTKIAIIIITRYITPGVPYETLTS